MGLTSHIPHLTSPHLLQGLFPIAHGYIFTSLWTAVSANIIRLGPVEHGLGLCFSIFFLDNMGGPSGYPGNGKNRRKKIPVYPHHVIDRGAVEIDIWKNFDCIVITDCFFEQCGCANSAPARSTASSATTCDTSFYYRIAAG